MIFDQWALRRGEDVLTKRSWAGRSAIARHSCQYLLLIRSSSFSLGKHRLIVWKRQLIWECSAHSESFKQHPSIARAYTERERDRQNKLICCSRFYRERDTEREREKIQWQHFSYSSFFLLPFSFGLFPSDVDHHYLSFFAFRCSDNGLWRIMSVSVLPPPLASCVNVLADEECECTTQSNKLAREENGKRWARDAHIASKPRWMSTKPISLVCCY